MDEKTIERASELLREQEEYIYERSATLDTPPVEESEAFEIAELLEESIEPEEDPSVEKEDVCDAIKKIGGPVKGETIAQFLYADSKRCFHCHREYVEYRNHKKNVETRISQLVAEGRLDGDGYEYWIDA